LGGKADARDPSKRIATWSATKKKRRMDWKGGNPNPPRGPGKSRDGSPALNREKCARASVDQEIIRGGRKGGNSVKRNRITDPLMN